MNDYGPNKLIGSVHLELPDTMTIEELDALTRKLQTKVHKETGVTLTGVGVYSYNTGNNEAAKIRNDILHIVKAHEWALQMHGFFVDFEEKTIRFDVVLSFDIMPEEALEILNKDLSAAYPEFSVHIAPDLDI